MITHGKGTKGRRPYRGDFSRERLAASSYDLQRAIERAKARKGEKFGGQSHDFMSFDEAVDGFKEWSEDLARAVLKKEQDK